MDRNYSKIYVKIQSLLSYKKTYSKDKYLCLRKRTK